MADLNCLILPLTFLSCFQCCRYIYIFSWTKGIINNKVFINQGSFNLVDYIQQNIKPYHNLTFIVELLWKLVFVMNFYTDLKTFQSLSVLLACNYSNCKCYDKVRLGELQVQIILGKVRKINKTPSGVYCTRKFGEHCSTIQWDIVLCSNCAYISK